MDRWGGMDGWVHARWMDDAWMMMGGSWTDNGGWGGWRMGWMMIGWEHGWMRCDGWEDGCMRIAGWMHASMMDGWVDNGCIDG